MRAALVAVALLMAGACGGSPSAPSPAAPLPAERAVTLGSGPYTLAITLSTSGRATCQNGFCSSLSLCFGNPSQATASFNVTLERSADTATVRVPGGASPLVLTLTVAPTSVAGSISGSGRDTQGVMVETTGTITGVAPGDSAYAVSGNLDGQLSFGAGGCSNNGHLWSLVPR